MEKIEKVVFNTSFHVEADFESEFVAWLRDSYLPGLRAEEGVEILAVSRLLMQLEEGLISYSVRIGLTGVPVQTAVKHGEHLMAEDRLEGIRPVIGSKVVFFTTPMVDIEL